MINNHRPRKRKADLNSDLALQPIQSSLSLRQRQLIELAFQHLKQFVLIPDSMVADEELYHGLSATIRLTLTTALVWENLVTIDSASFAETYANRPILGKDAS